MKTTKLLCGTLLLAGSSFAQTVEISGTAFTGISKFGGSGAAKSSFIYTSITADEGYSYTNNPYGARFSINDGIGMQAQFVSERKYILGAQLGVEQLRSRTEITGISSSAYFRYAKGHTTLRHDFINLNPYFGKRLFSSGLDVDLLLGTDLGVCLKSEENGEAEDSNGETITTSEERIRPRTDVRPRIGLAMYKNRFGLNLSYAHGLTSYTGERDGSNVENYMRVVRLGLSYRL
ncbi:outer membrane beta-barrel protein [Pontibacter oryzae]|uniref:PorT family protein n=1 Tax=Pontibacter oryzae TaxID=2304593 RepID=A0A399SFL1_9BACT|nr:outer membrane beta-barrel protein [Pontibacter oryzae]RIJ41998.1 hypothetical protein D1627_08335 [Pontibacter oryzae]